MSHRPCPVCGSPDADHVEELRYVLPDASRLPRTTWVRICSRCEFAFIDSNASESDYLDHYATDSIYADVNRIGSGILAHDRERLSQSAARMHSWVQPGDLLIDIGASTGGMLAEAARSLQVRAVGIDPDPRCVEVMRQNGFESRRGTLQSLPADLEGLANAICLSHVLEHLWDPVRGMQFALKLLRNDGVIYVETPDSSGYISHPNVWRYYLDPEHINHFQPSDFFSLAKRITCEVVDFGRGSPLLEDGTAYPVAWAVLRRQGRPGSRLGPKPSRPHPIETYLLTQQQILRDWQDSLAKARSVAQGPMLIWGTGSHAQRILGSGLIGVTEIAAFIDSDPAKRGKSLLGLPILTPAEAFAVFPGHLVGILAARAAAHSISRALADQWPDQNVVSLS